MGSQVVVVVREGFQEELGAFYAVLPSWEVVVEASGTFF